MERASDRPKRQRKTEVCEHALDRVRQRYPRLSSKTDLGKIIRHLDQRVNCHWVREVGSGCSEYQVRYHGQWVRLIYSHSHRKVVTFLPW